MSFSKVRVIVSGVNNDTIGGSTYSNPKTSTACTEYRAGKLKNNYIWCYSDYDYSFDESKWSDYSIMSAVDPERVTSMFALNFDKNPSYRTEAWQGLCPQTVEGGHFSIYRREYQKIGRIGDKNPTIVKTEWDPVAVNISDGRLRDFNVTNNRSYQYILYPNYGDESQRFANGSEAESSESPRVYGDPVSTHWQNWSICELTPVKTPSENPGLKKTYTVDLDNIWLFKYSLETGTQTQNIAKSEYRTLGQYSKFGYGQTNAISGEVSCLLGSEMIPFTKDRYIERLWKGIDDPASLSTNQKVDMLNKWRKFVFSKNPKLLRDIKGQSWIVQVISGANTPKNFYRNQPDTISFAWRQIDSTEDCVIYGPGDFIPQTGDAKTLWRPWSEIAPKETT